MADKSLNISDTAERLPVSEGPPAGDAAEKKPAKRTRKLLRRSMSRTDAPEPMRRGFSGRLLYHIGMNLTRLGAKIEVEGVENLPDSAPFVLAANHETFVDGMWIMSALPKALRMKFCCIGAQDLLTKYGPFGRVIMRVGRGIPINRSGNPIRALVSAKSALDKGDNILLVHPEGTRTRSGKLGRIQEGACYIAIKADVPLVPVFLDGGYNIFNRHMKLPSLRHPQTKKRHRLIISFGKALLPSQFESIREMNEALSAWLHERFQQKRVPTLPFTPLKNAKA